jgi:hypothetical protein
MVACFTKEAIIGWLLNGQQSKCIKNNIWFTQNCCNIYCIKQNEPLLKRLVPELQVLKTGKQGDSSD